MTTSLLRNLSTGIVGVTLIALETIVAAPSYATTLSLDSTFGDNMTGMKVTADFLGGGSQTATWGVTGLNSGGAFGTDWSLTQSGDTFFDPWTFTNNGQSITSLAVNGVSGNTAFDTIYTLVEPPSTPASANGKPFTVLSGSAPTSFAYSAPIDISKGDLFGDLSLNYSDGFTGTATFVADTDNGTADNPVSVPEPSFVLGLLTVSLLGAASSQRSRRQKQNG